MEIIIEEMFFLKIKRWQFCLRECFWLLYNEFGVLLFLVWVRFVMGVFLLGYFFISHKNKFSVSLTMLPPPTMEPHLGICLGENSFAKGYQGYIFGIFILMTDGYIVFLCFHYQDNYSPRDKGYGSFFSMIDPTGITHWFRFLLKSERGLIWSADWLDLASPTIRPSSPVSGVLQVMWCLFLPSHGLLSH